jgi:hypothetical protein
MQLGGNGTIENNALIPEIWSKTFFQELRASLLLADLFSRDYEGEIKKQGDKVKVQQIKKAVGEILTSDKQKYNTQKMEIGEYEMTADKRVSAGFKFTDLASLQSQAFEEDAKAALSYGVMEALENYLIAQAVAGLTATALNPTAAGVLAKSDITRARTALSKAKVPFDGQVYAAYDPDYYGDLLESSVLTSSDFVDGKALMSQQLPSIYKMKHFEHNILTADQALFFHRTFINMVMQQELRIKISDLHPLGEYGYVMTADLVFGSEIFEAARGKLIKAP